MKVRRSQSGLAIVEFTFLATVLFIILFAIIDIGMYTYSVQRINEITRKAARVAAVCPVSDANVIPAALKSGAPRDFGPNNLVIEYLGQDGSKVGEPPEDYWGDIYYVRAKAIDASTDSGHFKYRFASILSFLGDSGIVAVPEFSTTLPAESLGVLRPTEDTSDENNRSDCSKIE